MATCQCGCGQQLTGRQRKWANKDTCRKRAKRRRERSVRLAFQKSDFRPLSQGRLVTFRLIIDSNGEYPHLYESGDLLRLAIQNVTTSDKMCNLVREELERRIPGYMFKIVILSGEG